MLCCINLRNLPYFFDILPPKSGCLVICTRRLACDVLSLVGSLPCRGTGEGTSHCVYVCVCVCAGEIERERGQRSTGGWRRASALCTGQLLQPDRQSPPKKSGHKAHKLKHKPGNKTLRVRRLRLLLQCPHCPPHHFHARLYFYSVILGVFLDWRQKIRVRLQLLWISLRTSPYLTRKGTAGD